MVYFLKILPLAPFRLKEHQRNKEHLNWRAVTQVESKESKVIEILQGEPSTIYPGCPERACGHNTADTTSQLCPLQSVIVIQWKLYTSLMTNCAFSVEYISLGHFWMIKIKGLFYSFIPCDIIFQFFVKKTDPSGKYSEVWWLLSQWDQTHFTFSHVWAHRYRFVHSFWDL